MTPSLFLRLWAYALRAVYDAGGEPGRRTHRLALVLFTLVLASVGGTWWALRHEPIGGVGVELVLVLASVVLMTCFVACLSEFALTSRPQFGAWLRTQPVNEHLAQLLVRAPVLTVALAAALAAQAPLAILVHTSLGGAPFEAVLLTNLALVIGPLTAPLLVFGAQVAVLRLRAGGLYGGALILLWFAWALLSGAVLQRMFTDGVEAGSPLWTRVLVWPGLLRAIFLDGTEWAYFSATLIALAALSLLSVRHLKSLDDVDAMKQMRITLSFARAPLVVQGVARSLRNRRSRAYLSGGLAFLVAYTIWDLRTDREVSSESAALIVALFLGGYATVKRGLSAADPVEVRLLTSMRSWAAAHIVGAWLVTLPFAVVAGCAFWLAADRPEVLPIALAMTWLAVNAGLLFGAVLVPQKGDATAEMMAAAGVLALLVLAGNVSDAYFGDSVTAYVAVLALLGSVAAVAAFERDRARWSNRFDTSREIVA